MQSRLWTLAIALLLLVAVPVAADGIGPPLLEIRPHFCRDPCAIRMVVGLEPHEYDRELLVEAESGAYYRSSFIQLDGEAEPAVHMLIWKALPPGEYEVRATLKRVTGETTRAVSDVIGR